MRHAQAPRLYPPRHNEQYRTIWDTSERTLDSVIYSFLHPWFGLCRAGVRVYAIWRVCPTA